MTKPTTGDEHAGLVEQVRWFKRDPHTGNLVQGDPYEGMLGPLSLAKIRCDQEAQVAALSTQLSDTAKRKAELVEALKWYAEKLPYVSLRKRAAAALKGTDHVQG